MKIGTIHDISRPVFDNMPVWPGDPLVSVTRAADMPEQPCRLTCVSMGMHAGTHVDAPSHMLTEGQSLDAFPLKRFMGHARVVEVTGDAVTAEDCRDAEPGEIILFRTRNSVMLTEHEFHPGFVALEVSAARELVRRGVSAVGIDGPSVEQFGVAGAPVHKVLLGAGMPLFENLVLSQIACGHYTFIGLPVKVRGAEGAPVRAILIEG